MRNRADKSDRLLDILKRLFHAETLNPIHKSCRQHFFASSKRWQIHSIITRYTKDTINKSENTHGKPLKIHVSSRDISAACLWQDRPSKSIRLTGFRYGLFIYAVDKVSDVFRAASLMISAKPARVGKWVRRRFTSASRRSWWVSLLVPVRVQAPRSCELSKYSRETSIEAQESVIFEDPTALL